MLQYHKPNFIIMDFYHFYSFPNIISLTLNHDEIRHLDDIANNIYSGTGMIVCLRNSKFNGDSLLEVVLSVSKRWDAKTAKDEQLKAKEIVRSRFTPFLKGAELYIEIIENHMDPRIASVTPEWFQKMLDFHGLSKREFARLNSIDESNVSSWTSNLNPRKMSDVSKTLVLNFFIPPKLHFRILDLDPLIIEMNTEHFLIYRSPKISSEGAKYIYTFRSKYGIKIKPIEELSARSKLFNEAYLQIIEGMKVSRIKCSGFDYSYDFEGKPIGFNFYSDEELVSKHIIL